MTEYDYNLQGRMASVEIDTDGDGTVQTPDLEKGYYYTYNDQGIRVSVTEKTDTGDDGTVDTNITTDYLIDANNPIGYAQVLEEIDAATGEVIKSYTLGHDVISQADAAGNVHYFLYDGHGSTRALLNSSGSIVAGQVFAFDAYGERLDNASALTSHLYCGEICDNTGLIYLRQRYYRPGSGTLTTLDPFVGDLQDPQSLHKYLYCHADPINMTDPTGMFGLAGFSVGFGIANSIANIKNSGDLAVFDATVTTIAGIQAGQSSAGILTSFFVNQGIGFGVGYAVGKTWQAISSIRTNGIGYGYHRAALKQILRGQINGSLAPLFRAFGVSQSGRLSATARRNIWGLEPATRGVLIEDHLAITEYADWFHVGREHNGYFPLIDFQNGQTVVSLKTVNTNGATWVSRMKAHIDELYSRGAYVNGNRATTVLDLRVQPGGTTAAKQLLRYAEQKNVILKISEFM